MNVPISPEIQRRIATWVGVDGLRDPALQDDDFEALKRQLTLEGRAHEIAGLEELREEFWEAALLQAQQPDAPQDPIVELVNVAECAAQVGDLESAAKHYQQAIDFDPQVVSVGGRSYAAWGLSSVLGELGDKSAAVRAAEIGVEVMKPLDSPMANFIANMELGWACLKAGQIDRAESLGQIPVNSFDHVNPSVEIQRFTLLAQCSLARGDYAGCNEHLQTAFSHCGDQALDSQLTGAEASRRATLWSIVAARCKSLGQLAEALAAYLKAVEFGDRGLEHCFQPKRPFVLSLAGRYEALAACQRLLSELDAAERSEHTARLLRLSQHRGARRAE